MASNFFFFNTSDSKDDEDSSCFKSLTFKERLLGFAVCFALGINIFRKNKKNFYYLRNI